MKDSTEWYVCPGTVQPFLGRKHPFAHLSWGSCEYDRDKPVLSDDQDRRAKPVVDRLNRGEITPEEAVAELNRVAYW